MQNTVYSYSTVPNGFNPTMHAAGVVLRHGERVLLLNRHSSHASQGGCWGCSGGKIDPGETPLEAAKRELFEETGISIDKNALNAVDSFHYRVPGQLDYIFHVFQAEWNGPLPKLHLSPREHVEGRWVTIEEAAALPVERGAGAVLSGVFGTAWTAQLEINRRISIYGAVIRDGKILLIQQTTGAYAGYHDLPGGGMEVTESPERTLAREFVEEVAHEAIHCTLAESLTVNVWKDHGRRFLFHHTALIYDVADVAPRSDVDPEEIYDWYPLEALNDLALGPFAHSYLAARSLI